MRHSAWLVPLTGGVLFTMAVALPVAIGVRSLFDRSGVEVDTRSMQSLFFTSLAWSISVAACAALLGWLPGRWLLRKQGTRGAFMRTAILLAPVCLPSYVVFWFWWQLWPPDSFVYRWAVEHDAIRLLRMATLALGLVCWSWPIVSWCVAGAASSSSAQREQLLAIDGASRWERLAEAWRNDRRGLLIGGLVVALATFTNTTCFDLAEVFTFANEIRAVQALGAPPAQVLAVSLPAVAVSIVGSALLWALLKTKPTDVHRIAFRTTTGSALWTAALWCASIVVPLSLFIPAVDWKHDWPNFTSLYSRSIAHTLALAGAVGALGAAVAAGFVILAMMRSRTAALATAVLGVGWLMAAALPGTTFASLITAAFNDPPWLSRMVYATPIALVLALLARTAFLAALLGRTAGLSEPIALRELRTLDDASGALDLLRTAWPRLAAAMGASFVLVGVLAASEIVVTSQIYPPRLDPLAPIILSAMHYQQPETVMLASIGLVACAVLATLLAGLCWTVMIARRAMPLRAKRVLGLSASLLSCALAGCDDSTATSSPELPSEYMFGGPGISPGQFSYPRCMAADCERNELYIIDKTARVQRFSSEGKLINFWNMPIKDNGKPTGVSVAPDGRIFVADTHYFRVMAFDRQGRELMQFGSYGTQPGQFIYPTDVAFSPNGNIYVSEYGGNDRIQVFDSNGKALFQFGSPGNEHGQFTRPQALAFNADGSELFVADACNHRIQVFAPKGEFIRSIGSLGRGPGELAYPYSVIVLDDASLLVTEFGNNRIQRLSKDGAPLGMWGSVGRAEGQLQYPWSAAACQDALFVLDSGNNRVQVMTLD